MARATRLNARSQPRNTQPSQSQRPTQTQRGRRAATEDDDEEGGGAGGSEEEQERDEPEGDAETDMARRAKALVRLALFNEYKRTPLRRDEINKKVLGTNTRAFNLIFAMAQETLQQTFGMELVELMSRAEREKEQNGNDETRDGENATGLKKKATAAGSKTYILRSTLDAAIIEAAAASDAQILEDEELEIPEDDEDEDAPVSYGSIISWSSADQLGAIGLLYVLLALIMVSGGVLSDMDLKKYLKSLRLTSSALVYFTPQSTHKSLTIEAYLASLVKQGYLDKTRAGVPGAPRATQGKRGRGSGGDDEGGNVEWKWGSRAQAEIGERALARFIGEFLVERMERAAEADDDDDAEEGATGGRRGRTGGKKKKRSREDERERMLEAMLKGITRAAGGKLSEAK